MELSVIIVNYRSREYLEGCLESIERYVFQSPLKKKFEVILVNNDKEDLVMNKSFSFSLKIFNQEENRGFGSANNVGASEAKGDYLFFLNPDTKITGYGLTNMINYAKSNPAIGAVGPKIILANENRPQPWTSGPKTNFWRIVFRNTCLKPWNKEKITQTDWLSGTALLLKKVAFQAIGGFDENIFMYFEDQDLCLRLKKAGKGNFFYPFLEIIHFDGKSWQDNRQKKECFYRSQDYFFAKHNPAWQKTALKLIRSIFYFS